MKTYPISQAISDVAELVSRQPDQSPTTIRCAMNDLLDAMHREGYRVRFDFNQDKAVARVVRKLKEKQ